MKKFTVTLISAAAAAATTVAIMATPAVAQTYKGAPHTFPVTIPALKDHFLFNVEGIYAQPSSAPFSRYNSILYDNGIGSVNYVDPEYQWAFKLGFGYTIDNTGNDVQLNWTYLKNTSDDSITQTGSSNNNILIFGSTGNTITTTATFEPDAGDTIVSTGKTTLKYNAVDLDLGQYVNFGSNLSTRWLIGARYAQITGILATSYNGTEEKAGGSVNANSFSEQDTAKTKLNGIGPRFGMSANYMVYNGAGIVAAASGFLLASQVKNTAYTNSVSRLTSSGALTTNNSVLKNDYKTIIPGFDGKVGINYARANISHNLSYLNVEAGYQITHYSNGLDSTLSGFALQHSDFGFSGPYLGMNLRFS